MIRWRGIGRLVSHGIVVILFFQVQSGFSQDRTVPAWAKEAVWYQIFPERFRNGDPGNDPTANDIRGSWPHEDPRGWKLSPWTGDWYKLQPWEEAGIKGFYFRAQQRRYGGDLQGVLDKLDYLSDLGINAMYFNPIFESPSLHKYDTGTFHHVDGNFGPDPKGDQEIRASENPSDPETWKWTAADRLFLKLLHEAHKRNIKVIIDGVFHCTGMTFWAFEDLRKNRQQSRFTEWYNVKKWDDPSTPEDEFDYEGWFGVRELPEFKKTGKSLAAGPKDHIHAIVRRWMDPNNDGNPEDGIDGWRLDAAEMVPSEFWMEFRTWVRAINPHAYLTGELWWEDWKNDKIFNAAPWLQGDRFDAVMNYRWAREVIAFFAGDTTAISVTEFDKRLRRLREDYPSDVNYVLMNLLDSHDTDRLGSMVVNVDSRYDHNIGVSDNRAYNVRKPNAEEIRTQKLIALFQMTSVGAPMIYYGDEAGMWGADDPDERKPMLWPDMQYDDESHHPFQSARPVDKNTFDHDLFDWYKQLIHIRRSHQALSTGDCTTLLTDDANKVYVFRRSNGNQDIVVALNNSGQVKVIPIPQLTGQWKSLLGDGTIRTRNGSVEITLSPGSGAIIVPVLH